MVLQRLLAHNDIPAAGKGPEHERLGPGLAQLKCDGMRVPHVDGFHGTKQRRARAAKPLGRKNDALIRGLDVLGGQSAPIVKGDALAQEERVGFAVLGNLPTVCQVRNDGLATIAWVTPNQVVIHRPLGVYVGVGT